MNHKERFLATLQNAPVDRPASWLGLPAPETEPALLRHFNAASIREIKTMLDDDIYPVEAAYHCPPSNHIACAFDFAKNKHSDSPDHRTLTAPGFFEDYDDPAAIGKFPWPDPAHHLDRDECARRAKSIHPDYARMGILWSAHFQDACAAFGMEQAFMVILTNPPMFRAVINRITEFYLKANEMFYEATRGHLDAVLIGNDFGSQRGLMVSPQALREFVFPGTKKLVDQAHAYGLKVLHHSCGSIFPVISDLIALGVDIIHPIQPLAEGMDAANLKLHFAGKTAFCGGVDVQHLLVNGTPEEVTRKVMELRALFPTGLILSPGHEAILSDIPPSNVDALFKAVRSSNG